MSLHVSNCGCPNAIRRFVVQRAKAADGYDMVFDIWSSEC
jgi:hypothetical protein